MSGPEQKTPRRRTTKQNRALHLYFSFIANALNEAGLDMRAVLNPDVDIPWSPKTVKEYMWKPIQHIQLIKRSTTDLTTKDIDAVFNTLNRHLGEKTGVHVPFPSLESLMEKFKKQTL